MLIGAEINYSITEMECLAVLFAIKQFRIYFYGTHFTIITDHTALKWLMSIVDPTARLARWAVYLQMYDFTIIPRRGSQHANADALSRPVVDDDIENCYRMEIETVELDIYKNEHLNVYVRTKKHLSGASKKQISKIERYSKKHKYKAEVDEFYYRKNEKSIWLCVPKIEERAKIIEKNHTLGHFQVNSTYNRIREKYYWVNMIADISKTIKKCLTCQRNEGAPILDHEAKALKVTGIFDRIGVDLVFGLPMTNEGYIGVIVITEYLSKYPYVKPIKSKTAIEIAERIWEYICMFGPPKEILTDQGKEFNNSIMDKLVNYIGAEHITTSAYLPRCNGLTERFNSTLIKSLRKHCENFNLNWDKWIPYILYAYRSRVHSTTNMSPFEVMFGIKMNSFDVENVATFNSGIEQDTIVRNKQLNELINVIHPNVIEQIEINQEKQKKIQNNRQNTQIENLPIGIKVFLKNDGLLSKLEAKYSGPYIIHNQSNRGNYYLKDKSGFVLNDAIPLCKLKIIKDDESINENEFFDSVEIDKILDHSPKEGRVSEYLVSWKNRNKNENEWVKVENFNSKEVIEKYWKNKKQNINEKTTEIVQKRGRGRPKKSEIMQKVYPIDCNGSKRSERLQNKQTKSVLMIILLLIILPIIVLADITIQTKSQFCTIHSKLTPLEPSDLCIKTNGSDANDVEKTKQLSNWIKKYTSNIDETKDKVQVVILSKRQNEIIGKGHQCQMMKITQLFTQTLLGDKFESNIRKEYIKLSAYECMDMIEHKRCKAGNKIFNLTCIDDNCEFNGVVEPKYSWWSTVQRESYQCSTFKRSIIASKKSDTVFNNACHLEELSCVHGHAIIVWKKELLTSCPFDVLTKEVELTIKGHILTST